MSANAGGCITMVLTPRKEAVLQAVIHEYIATAVPVGSKAVVEKYNLGVSSATIRNDMAELEEYGYLSQPHTSAGRVPTDQGYRLYVDTLVRIRMLTEVEQKRIRLEYESVNHEIEGLLQETTRVMSLVTGLASLVVAPSLDNSVLRCVEMVPLSTSKVLMVLVTSAGLVENRVIDVPFIADPLELRHICMYINERLQGLRLATVRQRLLSERLNQVRTYRRFFDEIFNLVQHILDDRSHERIYMEGVSNIISQPEFQDIQALRGIIAALEGDLVLSDLLCQDSDTAINVIIGHENRHDVFSACSIVTAKYYIDDDLAGSISIVGPTRMDYVDIIEKVCFTADNLSRMIRRIGTAN